MEAKIRKKRNNNFDEMTKESALGDYCRGFTIANIALKYNVSVPTVNYWSREYCWKEEKRKFAELRVHQINETLFDKLAVKLENSLTRFTEFSMVMAQMGVEVVHKVYKEKEFGIDSKVDAKLKVWVDIMERNSRIIANVIPDPDEQVAQQILKDFEKLKISHEDVLRVYNQSRRE